MHIHGLEVPVWAGGEVFVSTHMGLLRIDSEGEWYEVGDVKHDFMGFSAHPSEEGVLYSSGHPDLQSGLPNPIGFMVSRDAGASWEPLALTGTADFHALAVQQTDGDVVYGFNVAGEAGLYRSFDGGHNWERVDSPDLLEVGGALSLEVHPQDREALFAGTQAGLYYSGDGGRSWENVALQSVPVTAVRFAPGGAGKLFVYGAHPEAGLLVSEDGGASWDAVGFVLDNNDAVGYIAPHPEDEDILYLGSYGQDLYRTTDGKESWQTLAENGVPLRR